jgi:hypothetical protein
VVDNKLEDKAKAGANLCDHEDGQGVPQRQRGKRQHPSVSDVKCKHERRLNVVGRRPMHHLNRKKDQLNTDAEKSGKYEHYGQFD